MWWPWCSPCTDGSTRTATARRSVNSSRTVYNILQHPAVESYSWRIGWLRPTRWSLVMLLGQVVCKCSYQWVYSSATLISKLTSCAVDKYTRVNGTERRSPSRCSKHKQGSCRVLRSVILSAFRWNLFFFDSAILSLYATKSRYVNHSWTSVWSDPCFQGLVQDAPPSRPS